MRQTGARNAVIVGVLLLVGLGGGAPLLAQETDRAIGVAGVPTAASVPVPLEGAYWALLIGIDEYAQASNLESAVKDVQAVRAVLETRYGFHPSRIKQLLNAEATRAAIVDTLYRLKREVREADSLFIYYAGHGQYEQEGDHGWWVPADADPTRPSSFIDNEIVLQYLKGMQAKHVYLVADSCFSGSLFGTRALPPITARWYAELYKARSRWGLTSGATEPVADSGKAGHSPFAYFLLKVLRENAQPYLVPSEIAAYVAPRVANNTEQRPLSEPLRRSGDEGGQFVFRLTGVGATAIQESDDVPSPSLEVSQLAMEREFWNAIKDSQHPQEFAAYLKRYPDGTFAELARQRLEAGLELTPKLRQVIQRGLAAAGFDPGGVSGRFDAGTRTAIGRWQAAQGGRATGYLDEGSAADLLQAGGREIEREEAEKARQAEFELPMVHVQGGTFRMGCTEEQSRCDDDEKPDHLVRVDSFEIGQYEVTQDLWEAVMGENPSFFGHCSRCPVEHVSWDDVKIFLKKLNTLTEERYGFRLPTEAEWEYAARGGPQGKGYEYAGSDAPGLVAWYEEHSGSKTHPVGQKEPNELGLYDLSGNVWEWVQDCWNDSYDGAPGDGRAWETEECSMRVLRGGSWIDVPGYLRSADRIRFDSGYRSDDFGFRVARTLTP